MDHTVAVILAALASSVAFVPAWLRARTRAIAAEAQVPHPLADLPNSNVSLGSQPITAGAAAELLAQEWRFRHELFWRSLYRWGGVNVALLVAPFVRPEIIPILGASVLVIPGLVIALSLVGAWHLAAEYSRLSTLRRNLDVLVAPWNPRREIRGPAGLIIGDVVPRVFAIGMPLLALAVAAILLRTLP